MVASLLQDEERHGMNVIVPSLIAEIATCGGNLIPLVDTLTGTEGNLMGTNLACRVQHSPHSFTRGGQVEGVC